MSKCQEIKKHFSFGKTGRQDREENSNVDHMSSTTNSWVDGCGDRGFSPPFVNDAHELLQRSKSDSTIGFSSPMSSPDHSSCNLEVMISRRLSSARNPIYAEAIPQPCVGKDGATEVTSAAACGNNITSRSDVPLDDSLDEHDELSSECDELRSECDELLHAEHELANTWVLWYKYFCARIPRQKRRDYREVCTRIKPFNTIETFLRLFNGAPPPSVIMNSNQIVQRTSTETGTSSSAVGSIRRSNGNSPGRSILGNAPRKGDDTSCKPIEALMFFQNGVTPQWEDPAHINGGVFQYKFDTVFKAVAVDRIWEFLIFAVLGNYLPHADKITGICMVDCSRNSPVSAVRVEGRYFGTERC